MEEAKQIPVNANEQCPGIQDQNAGKQDACNGCPNQEVCASEESKEPVKGQIKNVPANANEHCPGV